MKIQLRHRYDEVISVENLVLAWKEFAVGKGSKSDVQDFNGHLMDHIFALHADLVKREYRHGGYESFFIHDPKRRHIHKASVSDRVVHHALYRACYQFFDRTFIADSFSCRNDKGPYKAIDRFQRFARQVSRNRSRACWVLKCDIRKFFASIDHGILLSILASHIPDNEILALFQNIVSSFETIVGSPVGLPLGNLTSQLLANVYMNRFDQWVKHTLKATHYIRYADDFVFFLIRKTTSRIYFLAWTVS